MAEIINTTLEKLLAYRTNKNKELFITEAPGESFLVDVMLEINAGFIMKTRTSSKKIQPYLKYGNIPINKESLMIQTHNFGDSTTWIDSTNSSFELHPNSGYKLIITSIVARFPDTVNLEDNPLSFVIWKYIPPYGLVPAVTETYSSIKELLVTSNSWWHTVEFSNQNAFQGQMLEVKFRYAAEDTDDWSKLTMYSSRGEYIECKLANNTPLLNKDGGPLLDPCYSIFNTKRVLDF